MTSAQQIRGELEALGNQLSKARARTDEGETVDLTQMEDAVQAICNAMNLLPEDEKQGLKSPLLAVLEELDQLTGLIRQRLAELSTQLGETSDRRRAHTAYARTR